MKHETGELILLLTWGALKSKRRSKISAYFIPVFEYKRMRLFLSVYSMYKIDFFSKIGHISEPPPGGKMYKPPKIALGYPFKV